MLWLMQAVLATLRDPSFTFVDPLSVAAWGRIAGLRHRAKTSRWNWTRRLTGEAVRAAR